MTQPDPDPTNPPEGEERAERRTLYGDRIAEDGEFRMDFGCVFDRSRIWVCRRCGAMTEQPANHGVLHLDVDEASGKRPL